MPTATVKKSAKSTAKNGVNTKAASNKSTKAKPEVKKAEVNEKVAVNGNGHVNGNGKEAVNGHVNGNGAASRTNGKLNPSDFVNKLNLKPINFGASTGTHWLK